MLFSAPHALFCLRDSFAAAVRAPAALSLALPIGCLA
ncbi:hypothetical protein ACFDR9_003322 [Janthinobacterium sp. CG_23.3]|nr:hypothetical protein [Janthinobacterium sp. CG_S6]